ncbi:hypothetical protein EVAR_8170_1 [Eumeta japonica]|uniref:Uncharacterized protein n=1 Tax=Eumeta variegata TaxID=151549 RepID=A0A4C1TFE0_EUMVA|nr:hypothetical protein EVAR_8170_1 [Eumeta japonica]
MATYLNTIAACVSTAPWADDYLVCKQCCPRLDSSADLSIWFSIASSAPTTPGSPGRRYTEVNVYEQARTLELFLYRLCVHAKSMDF